MNVNERIRKFAAHKGLTIAEFERMCGLSNGYVLKVKDSLGKRGLSDILRNFPDLNKDWLLTGEGEMLNSVPGITQHQNGGSNNSQTVTVGQSDVGRFLDEIAAQRRMTEKAQEQIDRLLTLLENK